MPSMLGSSNKFFKSASKSPVHSAFLTEIGSDPWLEACEPLMTHLAAYAATHKVASEIAPEMAPEEVADELVLGASKALVREILGCTPQPDAHYDESAVSGVVASDILENAVHILKGLRTLYCPLNRRTANEGESIDPAQGHIDALNAVKTHYTQLVVRCMTWFFLYGSRKHASRLSNTCLMRLLNTRLTGLPAPSEVLAKGMYQAIALLVFNLTDQAKREVMSLTSPAFAFEPEVSIRFDPSEDSSKIDKYSIDSKVYAEGEVLINDVRTLQLQTAAADEYDMLWNYLTEVHPLFASSPTTQWDDAVELLADIRDVNNGLGLRLRRNVYIAAWQSLKVNPFVPTKMAKDLESAARQLANKYASMIGPSVTADENWF